MPEKVFISHAEQDPEWARRFADTLRGRGFLVRSLVELGPGESAEGALAAALRESDWIVLLVDRESVTYPSLFFDFGAAMERGSRIVLVVSSEVDDARLPLLLRRRQRLAKGAPEATAAALLARAA